ncbi:MAG: HAMP domain-containing sensor histidine kinase [Eubacteriales bacterium]
MKIREVENIALSISNIYESPDLILKLDEISYKSDVSIRIDDLNGKTIFSSLNFNTIGHMGNIANNPGNMGMQIQLLALDQFKEKIISSEDGRFSVNFANPQMESMLIAFGLLLPNKDNPKAILYVFAPLSPVDSTVAILKSQLIYISIISLFVAFLISLVISRKISRPILSMSKEAEKMAKGNYNVAFKTGNFTEIDQLAETLNFTAMELGKADTLHKDLIANVSHDLRTPLTMVKSYAELVRDVSINDPEKIKSHMQVIIDESDRLSSLVTDLLALSKIQSGFELLKMEKFILKPVISSILSPYLILEESSNSKFSLNCPDNLEAFGDKRRIEQVLSNLISNSIKFTTDEKRISIDVSNPGDGVMVKISDNGIGIPQDDLLHIWERYYESSRNYQRDQDGSGLGLAIVKEILELHKCSYGIDSEVHVGSTFWFKLPNS